MRQMTAIITDRQCARVLESCGQEVIERVSAAYLAHWRKETDVPPGVFVYPPQHSRSRGIAMPAVLARDSDVTLGMKWITSFPLNVPRGLPRAHGVIVLNDPRTGVPVALLAGSAISATRTAASAVLAARLLAAGGELANIGVIGCGRIAKEFLRVLSATSQSPFSVFAHDLSAESSAQFARQAKSLGCCTDAIVSPDLESVFRRASVVLLATSAYEPIIFTGHIRGFSGLILHLSLRDLEPGCLLNAENVVDDSDHAVRERTSLGVAREHFAGQISIIELASIIAGAGAVRHQGLRVFAPFGLAILDLTLAELVLTRLVACSSDEASGIQYVDLFGDGATIPSAL